MQNLKGKQAMPTIIAIGFFLSQISVLTRYPFMHSDESWLSGLTRMMMESNSLRVTEPFFDLYPRNPHAIKSTYHLLQALFIQVFGYELFSVRLMSLIFGCASLYIFYRLLEKIGLSWGWASLGTLLLAVQPNFIYAAHFARQEIVVCFFLLFTSWMWLNKKRKLSLLGLFIALGLHPNAYLGVFALLCAAGAYTWDHKEARHQLITLIPWLAGFTSIYILASFWMNPNFITDYLAYGSSLGVTADASGKFLGFFLFFKKLWLGISGTYYLPPLRLTLCLMAISLPVALWLGIRKKQGVLFALAIYQLAWGVGILIVGRYNATSVFFLLPAACLIFIVFIEKYVPQIPAWILTVGLIVIFSITSIGEITQLPKNHYESYKKEIQATLPADAVVLANLNTEFLFEVGQLYDYRNLAYVDPKTNGLKTYLTERGITHILYADELDYIHRNPQPWQVLYGPDESWYADMQSFLAENCQEIATLPAPIYGNRIVPFLNDPFWQLHIYQIKK
jgi:4-amino-4-deoxy-L-arabinose transferase-like glycosyltransferase